ncbi:MAG: glycoside hydrolase family 9 protein [Oscillospiraceae bacterium]|nr:glycoside hydrolase family 9 protein [Oscillospiraceae bacterium]
MKKRILSVFIALTMAVTVMPIHDSNASLTGVNYARLLQYLLYFYDANMCGGDAGEASGMTWRGNCHAYDSQIDAPWGEKVDLSGGFHDAGDHIKFGVTASYATMTMALAYREFGEAFTKTGQDEHMEIILKRFAEYLRKCTFMNADGTLRAYAYQVGDGRDHNFWGQPETQTAGTYPRIGYFITPDHPGTDQLMAAAGALASVYSLFGNEDDLKCALALYNAAKSWTKYARGDARSQDSFYQRYSAKAGPNGLWQDYGVAAAMWLHVGMGNATSAYLTDAATFTALPTPSGYSAGFDYWPLSWDSVWQLSSALYGSNPAPSAWGQTTGAKRIDDDTYQVTQSVRNNPTNYVFVHEWGSAVMNAGLQFMGLIYDKSTNASTGSGSYTAWARGQTDYLMGANPINRCYITGYSENSVRFTHHAGASGHTTQPTSSNRGREQLNLLVGALAGGPIKADGTHNDYEDDYVGNEVGITYNAPLIGAVAGLYLAYGNDSMVPDTSINSVKPTHVYPRTSAPHPADCTAHGCTIAPCNRPCDLHGCTISPCNRPCDLHGCTTAPCNRPCDLQYCTTAPCDRPEPTVPTTLFISAANAEQNGGWLEITNPTQNAVWCAGFTLQAGDSVKWRFPPVIVRQNTTVRVCTVGNNADSVLKYMQSDFKFTEGDIIKLADLKGNVTHQFEVADGS